MADEYVLRLEASGEVTPAQPDNDAAETQPETETEEPEQ